VRTWDDGTAADPRLAALVRGYRERLGDLATRTVAIAREPITRQPGTDGTSALGRLVCESMRAAAGADVALVPPDWLRADLPAGPLTYAQLFDAEPFGNDLIRMEMTGADLQAVLDEQDAPGQPRLATSGLPAHIDPDTRYSVVAGEFLAAGGEGFTAMLRGTHRRRLGKDVDALAAYAGHALGFDAPSPAEERP
jgi:5'-nucleotidase